MSFWKGKKVSVTGADGFIGSHLVERIVSEGAAVKALVYYNSFGNRGWLDDSSAEVMRELEVVPGDIRDAGLVRNFTDGCDYVFHLASLIAIPYSYQAPASYVQTNVMGGLNVLEGCKVNDVSRLVHTSTSEVYGSALYVPIDEKHPLQTQSPYSASKAGADMMAISYHRSFDLPVSLARPFNTYGPRQSARAVIPTILSQLHAGMTEIKLGALEPTRDFNYVADTVSGLLAIAESEETIGRVTNIGSGEDISIKDLFDICCQVTGTEAAVTLDDERVRPVKSEVDCLRCDSSDLRKMTDWAPAHSLADGLQLTSEWMVGHMDSFRPGEYSR